jgi:hypothetical protein
MIKHLFINHSLMKEKGFWGFRVLSAWRFFEAIEVGLGLAGVSIDSALVPVLNCRGP